MLELIILIFAGVAAYRTSIFMWFTMCAFVVMYPFQDSMTPFILYGMTHIIGAIMLVIKTSYTKEVKHEVSRNGIQKG